ncbi:MAG: four helix bundle protein [Deltaproteobacteria bacterium]|nr:four helix bundle protein [Thermoclostridium sp.]NLA74820.1 four helix bundle protein [Deltaproteobacteria bacterium]
MNQILEKSFDFSIRAVELIKYLDEEKKAFPLYERFLACATAIGITQRLLLSAGKQTVKDSTKAFSYVVEAEYLLEIMAKTGYLTEKQSQPIIDDCRSLKALITERANEMKPPAAPSSR